MTKGIKVIASLYTWLLKYLAPWVVFGRFRTVSDRFGPFSDCFGRFRTVSDRFRTVSDRFRTVSDRFGSFSDRFRTTNNPSKIFSVGSSGHLKTLQKCFRQGHAGTRKNSFKNFKFQLARAGAPPSRSVRPSRPAPALAN